MFLIDRVVKFMAKDAIPAVANASAATSVTTGFMSFLTDNATIISLGIAFTGLIVSVVAHVIYARIKARVADAEQQKIALEAKKIELELEKAKVDIEMAKMKNASGEQCDT